jgi:hypothetical protein
MEIKSSKISRETKEEIISNNHYPSKPFKEKEI